MFKASCSIATSLQLMLAVCWAADAHYTVTDLGHVGWGAGGAVLRSVNDFDDLAGSQVGNDGTRYSLALEASTLLALPIPNSSDSTAQGINAMGEVVGAMRTADGEAFHAFLFTSDGVADLHPVISQDGDNSWANDLNDRGEIVGAAAPGSAPVPRHAIAYRDGAVTDLHQQLFSGEWSEAWGINNDGAIVGAAQTADPLCFRAFLIRAPNDSTTSRGAEDLGLNAPFADCSSRAYDINDQGDIVGDVLPLRRASYGFLYSEGTLVDLNELIPSDSGWRIDHAYGISNSGKIVGFGRYLGQPRAFLLEPAPQQAVQQPAAGSLDVGTLLSSGDQYVGVAISVIGRIAVNVLYSARPCAADAPDCSPILGVSLLLEDLMDPTQRIPIYEHGNPFPCSHDDVGNVSCGVFIAGSVVTLNGVYTKGRVPDLLVGQSEPGGGSSPPEAIQFRDIYFFDLGASTEQEGAPRGERGRRSRILRRLIPGPKQQ